MITPEQLKEWKELCEKAMKGPWEWEMGFCGWKALNVAGKKNSEGEQLRVIYVRNDCVAGMRYEDAAFIAVAREAMPKLIEEVTRLREALERIKELPDNFHLGLVSDEAVKIAREALGGGE